MALYELALNYGMGPISVKSIVSKQGGSETYLEQIMVQLRRAGLVQSIRGAQGGYILAKQPDSINIDEIITAVEGPIMTVECFLLKSEPAKTVCKKSFRCYDKVIWDNVCRKVSIELKCITLQDLIDEGIRKTIYCRE